MNHRGLHSSSSSPRAPTAVAEVDLDLRGLRCPMPVLRTRKALMRLAVGERLRVVCSDPLAGLDIPHLVRETGDTMLDQISVDGLQIFLIART